MGTPWRRLAALTLCGAVGCGYTSSYRPPDNHRARPQYRGDQVVFTGPGGLPRCASEVMVAPNPGAPAPPMTIDGNGYWSPAVHVSVVHVGPMPPHWYVFPPSPGHVATHATFSGLGSLGGGGGGGGSGEGAGYLYAAMLAVALVASGVVAVGLAVDPPEAQVAGGIDGVNQFNDAARRKIAECVEQEPRVLAAPPAVEGTP